MKKIQLLAAIAMIAFTTNSFGQTSSVTATGNAGVSIITPIAISQTTPMDFGTIAVNGTAGTLVLSIVDNGTVATGGVQDMNLAGGTAAIFGVTGQAGESYSVTLPVDPVSLNGPSETLTVIDFVSSLTDSQGTIDTNGSFNVGATLNVEAGPTAAGEYTGTYQVTAQYL